MKNKKLFKYLKTFISSISILILSLLINGYSFSDFTINPAAKIEKLAGDNEVTKGFSNEEFKIFYINTAEGITEYAFSSRFGIWLGYEYPSRKNISGFTDGKNDIYYYGQFASNEMYDYIESTDGVKIYPNKTKLNGIAKCVYQIPYSNENISYKFVDSDNKINNETLFLNGEVKLTKYDDGEEAELISTIGQMKQDQSELWSLIDKIISSADKDHEIADEGIYSGRKSGDIEWDIDVNYETGDFINIEKRKETYDWTGTISYSINIKGQHPNTMGIHVREFTKVSMMENFSGESHVYSITVPIEIEIYFEGL